MNRDAPFHHRPIPTARASKPLCPMCGGVMRLSRVETCERDRREPYVLRCQCGWQHPVEHQKSYS